MVSDQDIAKGIQILLTQSNSKSFTTVNDVVHHLSQKLGFDLSHKVDFIRDQINLLLHFRSPQPPPPSISSPATTSGIPNHQFPFQHPQFHFNQHQHHHQQPQPHFVFQQPQPPPQPQPHRQVELNFSTPRQSPLPEVKSEGASVKNVVCKSSEKLKKGGSTTKRRGGPGGLNKLCGISPELQVIVGESSLSRTDTVKKLWAYIKQNNLQDPGNKRKIICDDALRVVFETDCTDMFKMNKLLAKHIIALEPTKESSRKRPKVNVEPKIEENVESTEFVPCQVIISEALANCLDMQEREMSQSEALRLVWEYIKVNNLEDPQTSGIVICDAKLKDLFGCESISAMEIPELLVMHHFLKK